MRPLSKRPAEVAYATVRVQRPDHRRRLLALLRARPDLDLRTLARAVGLDMRALQALLQALLAEDLVAPARGGCGFLLASRALTAEAREGDLAP